MLATSWSSWARGAAPISLALLLVAGCADDGRALRQILSKKASVATLAGFLDAPSPAVYGAAMRRLARLQKPAADAALKRALHRLGVPQRRELLASLLDSGRGDERAQELLLELLGDTAPLVRRTAVIGLGDVPGALSGAVWRVLIDELAHDAPARRRTAAAAIEARRWEAVAPLARALEAKPKRGARRIRRLLGRITGRDPTSDWRVFAEGAEVRMLALAERGRWPRDKAAVLKVLDDRATRPSARSAAIRALARLAPPEDGLKLLLERSHLDLATSVPLWGRGGEKHLERWVVSAKEALGTKAGPAALERLVRGVLALERSNDRVLLVSLVDVREPRVALAALCALDRQSRRLGPLPPAALAKLRPLVRRTAGPPSPLAVAAALALWRSGEQLPELTALLAKALRRAVATHGQGSSGLTLEQRAYLSNLLGGLAELAAWLGDAAATRALRVTLNGKLAASPAFEPQLALHLERAAPLVDLSASLEPLVALALRPSLRRALWTDVALTVAIQRRHQPALLRLARRGLTARQWRRVFDALGEEPSAISEALLRKALSSHESVQILALENVSRGALVAVADRVLELLKTGSRARRFAAARAAARLGQKRFRPPLTALYDAVDRDEHRIEIAYVRARCGDASKLPWVVEQLQGKYPTLFFSYCPAELLLLLEDRGKLPESTLKMRATSKSLLQAAILARRALGKKGAEQSVVKLVEAAKWAGSGKSAPLTWLRDGPARLPLLQHLERLALEPAARKKITTRLLWRVIAAMIRPADWTDDAKAARRETTKRGSAVASLRRLAAHPSTSALSRHRINRQLVLAAGFSRLNMVAAELSQLHRPTTVAPGRSDAPRKPATELERSASASRLNSMAWSVALRFGTASKAALQRALRWSKVAVKRTAGRTAAYLDTQALVQYRLGLRRAAISAQLRAARLQGRGVKIDFILRLRAYVGGTLATGRESKQDAALLRWQTARKEVQR